MPTIFEKQEANAKRMGYRSEYGAAAASYFDRREAVFRLKGDTENLEISRRERAQIDAWAAKHKMAVRDVGDFLSALHEHDLFPRSQEAIEQRRANTKETLRLEHGGVEQSQAYLRRYVAVTEDLAKEVPTLAARMNETGAGEDLRVIRTLTNYAQE